MAKDIKLYKDKEEITVNENNVDYYKSLGYTTEKKKEKQDSYKSTTYKDKI